MNVLAELEDEISDMREETVAEFEDVSKIVGPSMLVCDRPVLLVVVTGLLRLVPLSLTDPNCEPRPVLEDWPVSTLASVPVVATVVCPVPVPLLEA